MTILLLELLKLLIFILIYLFIIYLLSNDFKKLIKRLKKAHNIKEALNILDKYFFE